MVGVLENFFILKQGKPPTKHESIYIIHSGRKAISQKAYTRKNYFSVGSENLKENWRIRQTQNIQSRKPKLWVL